MVKKLFEGFWARLARVILRNRILILLGIVAATVFLGLQWKNMRFSNTEANLLPDDHSATIQYEAFEKLFGQEDNAVVIAVKDDALFKADNFNRWNKLSKQFEATPEIDFVISTDNLKELVKDNKKEAFFLKPLITNPSKTDEEVAAIKEHLFNDLPFYENLLFNKESGAVRMVAYMAVSYTHLTLPTICSV